MTEARPFTLSSYDITQQWRERRRALLILALTVLWHYLLFSLPWKDLGFGYDNQVLPPPVSVETVDSQKLEAIRKQWQQRKLLMSKNLPASNTHEAPKDARYFSDRNLEVEKEQRAAQTQVMPQDQPGSFEGQQTPSQSRQNKQQKSNSGPDIRRLGVPLQLSQGQGPILPAAKEQQNSADSAQSPQSQPFGGDQSINDPDLAIGNMNILNTAESVYYTYFSRLYQAVGPLWQSDIRAAMIRFKGAPKEYVTDVFVIFDDDGKLKRFEYVSSSGVRLFDSVMENAWQRIGRFPNPPKALIKNGEVRTRWTFRLDLNGYVPNRE